MISPLDPLFTAIRSIVTTGASKALADACLQPGCLLDRHCHGDWGDASVDDAKANDTAVVNGDRILLA